MVDTYLYPGPNGNPRARAATVTSTGVSDAGKIVALDANGLIAPENMPTGFGDEPATMQASENIAAGDYVNVHSVTGAFRIRKADASTYAKQADGFVLSAITSGNSGTVYFDGRNTGVTGMTPGPVFLSATTPGQGTSTVPSTTGQIVQRLGTAYVATAVDFEAGEVIEL